MGWKSTAKPEGPLTMVEPKESRWTKVEEEEVEVQDDVGSLGDQGGARGSER